jgi:hypothetical protein
VQPLVAPDAVVLLDGWIYDHLEVVARAGATRPAAGARHHPDYTASGALPDTVATLRKQHKLWQDAQERDPSTRTPLRHIINATDPLNLLGSLLPDKRVPHQSGNRILFEDGIPIAVLEKEEVKLLRGDNSAQQWELQKLLQKKTFPPRLRAYIGKL